MTQRARLLRENHPTQSRIRFYRHSVPWMLLIALVSLVSGCVRPMTGNSGWITPVIPTVEISASSIDTTSAGSKPTAQSTKRDPSAPILTPTPDQPHLLPTSRASEEQYTVQRGDTLGIIAQRFGTDINAIVDANQISDPNLLEVGQVLKIPASNPLPPGPGFKIIPDSELVNGPAAAHFDLKKFITAQKGFLLSYREDRGTDTLTGAEILGEISRDYSVNPRLLLAVLEYSAGWVTQSQPPNPNHDYPLGYQNPAYRGLYKQLSWAANNLNSGFYLWYSSGITTWLLADGSVIPPAPTLNPGTAAVQYFFSLTQNDTDWTHTVTDSGLFATYQALFGYPFDLAIEPLLPVDIQQPQMQLPLEPGVTWSFTGGPHGGWGNGSGWAAIDFAPPGEALGCSQSNAWVVAVADGVILRAADGAVIQDFDTDGFEQTGWTVLYMHIESRDRISAGSSVKAGDRIGHPSCEGGVSNGTHTHLARKYNGTWIAADGGLPFNLDGWVSKGNGVEYDGWLTRGDQTIEAWDGRNENNQISR